MQVMKRMLNTPSMERNKAASPNLALPSRSLKRTCGEGRKLRAPADSSLVKQSVLGTAGAAPEDVWQMAWGKFTPVKGLWARSVGL